MTKKVIETVNGWYMENPKQKVELDDIVGLVKTDEPTDSVQLQKEAQLSIYEKRIIELKKENEQLRKQKARYKRLSEIRNEEINNRILTIKEFIDNCSNEKVKKALEDLFYSEVNEYDLSKKYRKLREENQELKQELHKIYELTTVNKVRDIVENVYDDLLYETSDESDYARTKVLKCLEDIDNLRDDLE